MKRFQTSVAAVRTKDSLRALTKLCQTVDGELRIVGNPPLVTPIEDVLPGAEQQHLENVVQRMIGTYQGTLPHDRLRLLESYRYVHAARKVVGVGSVGSQAFIVLLQGRDDQDPLFLQVKEASASVLEDHLPRSRYRQAGERVVRGQRLMQAASDIFLGWTRGLDRSRFYYWRQLRDMKVSAVVEAMTPTGMSYYAYLCGWTLARAHARSGDPVALSEYLGETDEFDRAMSSFARRYADQNERDYEEFMQAIASGRLEAVTGV
jgi:uncharacterized protein (DUF2252 family)